VLGRHHDGGDFGWLAVLVTDGDLALGVRAKLAGIPFALVAGLGQQLEDLVGIVDRGWHQGRRFAAGIPEHDALVARTFFDPWRSAALSTPWAISADWKCSSTSILQVFQWKPSCS
jgi:hypothetical protein